MLCGMAIRGIDHSTCPPARVVASLWTRQERDFAAVLLRAFRRKVNVFVKVRVLDVIELSRDEPDKRRLRFWQDILRDQHFDYVICRPGTLQPPLRWVFAFGFRRTIGSQCSGIGRQMKVFSWKRCLLITMM